MIDIHLRADTPEALATVCPFLLGADGDGWAFDPIGPIVTTPGTYDDEGSELTPPVIDTRFHANLRCTDEIAALVPDTVRVYPNSPSRVWA